MTDTIDPLAKFIADDAYSKVPETPDREARLLAMLEVIAAESAPGLTIESLEVDIIRACREKVGLPWKL